MKINMNTLLVKQVSIFSALVGLGIGLITLIPVIGNIVFTFSYIAIAAGVIVYLKKNNVLHDISIHEGAILGAVIGTASVVGFLCVFIPLATIIQLIFNSGWIGQIVVACFSNVSTFMVLVFLLLFVVLLGAMMNAVSGAATAYVYNVLSSMKQSQENAQNDNKFTL